MTRQPSRTTGETSFLRPGRLVKVLAAAIGLHSCMLGILMLSAPGFMLSLIGFSDPQPAFFPSQSGAFLLIMGTFYLLAIKWPPFEFTILISKSFAVAFLTVHAGFLAAPPLIWVADLEDLLMLAAFAGAMSWRKRSRNLDHPPQE